MWENQGFRSHFSMHLINKCWFVTQFFQFVLWHAHFLRFTPLLINTLQIILKLSPVLYSKLNTLWKWHCHGQFIWNGSCHFLVIYTNFYCWYLGMVCLFGINSVCLQIPPMFGSLWELGIIYLFKWSFWLIGGILP